MYGYPYASLCVQDDLESENLRKVKFEFHSFSYYTLLEVIIGLTSALNQLQKVTTFSQYHSKHIMCYDRSFLNTVIVNGKFY